MTKHIANSLLSLIILSTMGHNREMGILYSTFDQLSVLILNLSTISIIGNTVCELFEFKAQVCMIT